MRAGPLIIAHRGDSTHAPENTLSAFRRAVEVGADGVEFDVQLAKDGVPVVIHDYDLKRTAGRDERVADLTSRQLRESDAGSWFAREFADEYVPSLEETLALLADFTGTVYIELKCEPDSYKPLVAGVCGLIQNSPLLPQIIIKSFRLAAIPEIKYNLPDVQTAALFDISITNLLRRREAMIALAREFSADQLSLHSRLASESVCSLARMARLPVTVWTVDDPAWIAKATQRGIGALITNNPARMIAARDRK